MISAYEVNEKDWKLFRNKIAGWQDAYIDKLNKEYINLLSSVKSHQSNSGLWKSESVMTKMMPESWWR